MRGATWAELVPNVGPMSADELMELPDDDWRYELVAGRRVRLPPTTLRHDIVASNLLWALATFAAYMRLGSVTLPDTGFLMSQPGQPDTVLVPAIAFVRAARMPVALAATAATDYILRVVPDLVVEIAAPYQPGAALADKAVWWLAAGVEAVWAIWPGSGRADT